MRVSSIYLPFQQLQPIYLPFGLAVGKDPSLMCDGGEFGVAATIASHECDVLSH